MHKFIFWPILLIYCSSGLMAQTRAGKGLNINEGVFYFYPAGSKEKYKIMRNDSMQTEVDLTSRDSTFYKILWVTDSLFTLKFLKSTRKIAEKQAQFIHDHLMAIKILKIESGYYTFLTAMDSIRALPAFSDTLWSKPRIITRPGHRKKSNPRNITFYSKKIHNGIYAWPLIKYKISSQLKQLLKQELGIAWLE